MWRGGACQVSICKWAPCHLARCDTRSFNLRVGTVSCGELRHTKFRAPNVRCLVPWHSTAKWCEGPRHDRCQTLVRLKAIMTSARRVTNVRSGAAKPGGACGQGYFPSEGPRLICPTRASPRTRGPRQPRRPRPAGMSGVGGRWYRSRGLLSSEGRWCRSRGPHERSEAGTDGAECRARVPERRPGLNGCASGPGGSRRTTC
jgi:hypothetical protein